MLKFDDNMWGFLDFASRKSIIGQIFANSNASNINLEGNFVKWQEGKSDMVTYLTASKFEKVESPWKEGRTPIKIGRFVRKFLNQYAVEFYAIDDAKIEEFVNLFKSYFTQDESRLKIVSGADIMKYYREDSYHRTEGKYGTLWNSCMRQPERNRFMQLYAARYKFMDRIYSFYDHDYDFFKSWASKNGYICKLEQSAKSERIFRLPDGSPANMELYVILEESDQDWYPYLDTFKFYNVGRKRFSNSDHFGFDYVLVQSNGERERHEEEPEETYFVPDDVLVLELEHVEVSHSVYHLYEVVVSGISLAHVVLRGVSHHHRLGVFSQTGYPKHKLLDRGVLALVEKHYGVVVSRSSHVCERLEYDLLGREEEVGGLASYYLAERVVV